LRTARITLVLTGLLALAALSIGDGRAGAPWLQGLKDAAPAPIATPVKTFKDCQEIARCSGCKPLAQLPPNARIIRVR